MKSVYKTVGLLLAVSCAVIFTISDRPDVPWPARVALLVAGALLVWLLTDWVGLFDEIFKTFKGLTMAAVVYFVCFSLPFWFLMEPHEWGSQLIKAYWPWWGMLLIAAAGAEAVGTVAQRASGDPHWKWYPFTWGPNHRTVVFPIFWVAAVEVLLTVGEFFRPLVAEGAALPIHPLLRWWVTVAMVWSGTGDGAALLVGVLTPAVIFACFLSVLGFAATVAAREIVRREREKLARAN